MNKDQMRSVLHNLTEEKAPASQINLLSAVQSRIQMSQSNQSKGIIMNKQANSNSRKLKPAFIAIAIVMIVAIFFSLPEGRTLAQEIMHFFTRGETNLMPGPTATPVKWVEQTPGVAAPIFTPQPTPVGLVFEADCGTFTDARCSIDEIRKMVAFKVFALPDLPDGMYFLGVTGGPESILLTYGTPGQLGYLNIREDLYPEDQDQLNWVLGADADIQSVQIGNVTGEYVKGFYDSTDNPPAWNSEADNQMLRWSDHGVLFTLFMTGKTLPLDRDDLVTLAATLTDGPVGENGVPVGKSPMPTFTPQPTQDRVGLKKECGSLNRPTCSIEDIRKLVNFPVFAFPEWPEGMYFNGATGYPSDVFLSYKQPIDQAGYGGSLVIIERPYIGASDQLSWNVGTDAEIKSVQIGDVTGEYVRGVYDGTNNTPPIWDPNSRNQELRWVNKGVLFSLSVMTIEPLMTIDEMLALAASLTDGPVGESGVPVIKADAPDYDALYLQALYPLSLDAIEELAGFKLVTPEKLPEPLSFVGASYDDATKIAKIFYRYIIPDIPDAMDGLVIQEQVIPQGGKCNLCGFVRGEFVLNSEQDRVPEDAIIETIQIDGLTGQYLEGVGWVNYNNDISGWHWDTDPYRKRARFQTGGLAIEVRGDRYEWTKADLITIAASLK